jgi:hypothetical protein
MGVPVIDTIDENFILKLSEWISDSKRVKVDFPDETAQIVDNMIKRYTKGVPISA